MPHCGSQRFRSSARQLARVSLTTLPTRVYTFLARTASQRDGHKRLHAMPRARQTSATVPQRVRQVGLDTQFLASLAADQRFQSDATQRLRQLPSAEACRRKLLEMPQLSRRTFRAEVMAAGSEGERGGVSPPVTPCDREADASRSPSRTRCRAGRTTAAFGRTVTTATRRKTGFSVIFVPTYWLEHSAARGLQ